MIDSGVNANSFAAVNGFQGIAARLQLAQDLLSAARTSACACLLNSPAQYCCSLPWRSSSNKVGTIRAPRSPGACEKTPSAKIPALSRKIRAEFLSSGNTATRRILPADDPRKVESCL